MNLEAQKAKAREFRYSAGLVINIAGPAIGAALLEGGVSKWIAAAFAVAGVLGGSHQLGKAAKTVKGQRADGMFDPTPEPEPRSPFDLVVDNLPALAGAVSQAQAEVESRMADLDKVRQVAADTLGPLAPAVEDVAKQVQKAGLTAVQQALAAARAGAQ